MKSTLTRLTREPVRMAGAVTFAPVRATAEVASQSGARIQGLLFREVMPPRHAPGAPVPSAWIEALPFVVLAICVALEMARLT